MAIVKNLEGTADQSCKCKSWQAHWEQSTGLSFAFCQNVTCKSPATVGAHVQRLLSPHNAEIVPLCASCNSLSHAFFLKPGAKLISAATCPQTVIQRRINNAVARYRWLTRNQ